MPDDTQQTIPAVTSSLAGDATPEHHMHLLGRYYSQVEAGRKTIEVRTATARKTAVRVGDTIVFHRQDGSRHLDVIVNRIGRYGSFTELLETEEAARIDPDASPAEQLNNLRAIYPPDKEALGVLAFEFDHRPGRPGVALPMSAEEFVHTLAPHSAYGCLYVRDEHDRPLQLRTVYGSRQWQFPGGTVEPGEDPLTAARRETVEETGLELGHGSPRLLLTHYLRPDPGWPMGGVGFIFDGGQLTPEQLRHIRLDPTEHDLWALHDLAHWQRLMADDSYIRLKAVERARHGQGPTYLATGP
ncbi:ASC-1 homology (ASCH) domain-containing protein [Actinacidiphila rubida]|uniref:ASC-1 homology (ASCH) domain-containing protein n=1 Tax=Actinacidiphila rubida TaxID=310780 RepID=A0A1H8TT13_9ACTN|nr:NUDIX domain-containing protein [Actinacidiphila rubida]SEO93673.1 ASC-1 homology (ASCH) domain-containing protein [Actinacidiphila rubida]